MLIVVCEILGMLLVLDWLVLSFVEGEVLLCVKCVGVCGIDLYIFMGN